MWPFFSVSKLLLFLNAGVLFFTLFIRFSLSARFIYITQLNAINVYGLYWNTLMKSSNLFLMRRQDCNQVTNPKICICVTLGFNVKKNCSHNPKWQLSKCIWIRCLCLVLFLCIKWYVYLFRCCTLSHRWRRLHRKEIDRNSDSKAENNKSRIAFENIFRFF